MDLQDSQQLADYVQLITKHQPALYAYILTLHPNRVTAQDILQEANMVLWQKAGSFQSGSNFKAWAFKIAYLQALAHLKREKRSVWLAFDQELLESLAEEATQRLEDVDERHAALKHCLEQLPVKDFSILRDHYESRHALAEIGRRLGRSQGAIKQVLLRVRRTLRTCIERSMKLARASQPSPT